MLRVEISVGDTSYSGRHYETVIRRRILRALTDLAEEKQLTVNYVKFSKPRSK